MGTAYVYLDNGNDDGTIFGQDSSELIGFWGTAPCDQPAAPTKALTTITFTTIGTADYAIAAPVSAGGINYGFSTADEMLSVLSVVANLQTRLGEVITALQECGLMDT